MKAGDESLVRMIPVDRIRVVNPRVRDKKKFEKIVESIALLGLKRPITVTTGKPADDGGETFDLVCGQGRLEAFIALGQKEIPALVRGFSPTDGLLASLIENIARRRGRALDQIRMIQWMKDQGHSPANIAAKTGLGVEYVKDILNLLSRGEERLLEAVLHGKLPATALAHYPSTSDEEAFQSRAALERDVRFGWDMWTWARLQARTGRSKVFYYYFAHVPPAPTDSPWARWGAGHWAELAYVFGHPNPAPGAWTREDVALSEAIIGYWTNFAKRGDPNGPGLADWPTFAAERPKVLHFDRKASVGGVANQDQLDAIDQYFTEARKLPATAP